METNPLPDALAALGKAKIGVCVTDVDLRYQWFNPAFSSFLGYDHDDLLGRTPFEITHPDDIDIDRDMSERVFRGEIPHFHTRKRFIRPNGSVVVGDLLATALFDDKGTLTGGLAVLVDASTSDPTTKRIEALQRSAAIGQVTASAIHDLRNNIAAIGLVSDSLESQYGRVPAVELLKYEVDGTMSLLSAIMSYARPTQPTPTYDSIGVVLSDANPLLRLAVPATTALDVMLIDPDITPTIGSRELQQVIMNLVLNARDATVGGGRISISAGIAIGEEACADIIVSDNGSGMTSDQLARAFDPYFTTKGDAGTGLGLSICRDIIERHGGRIVAESAAGVGSRFTIRLPISNQAAQVKMMEGESSL